MKLWDSANGCGMKLADLFDHYYGHCKIYDVDGKRLFDSLKDPGMPMDLLYDRVDSIYAEDVGLTIYLK